MIEKNIKGILIFCVLFGSIIVNGHPHRILELPSKVGLKNINEYLRTFDAAELGESTDCSRQCVAGKRRICYHRFTAEHYSSMGPACGACGTGDETDCFRPQCVPIDGIERNLVTINRQVPGPLIETCQDDIIVVDVLNNMHSDTFSIHWHGQLQRETQYMDGVPMITQCPIPPGGKFRYAFIAADAGTYFYHSHSGLQRYSGAYGALIIKSPTDDNSDIYDRDEHSLIVADWLHTAPELFYIGLRSRQPGLLPEALLINGKGKYRGVNETEFTSTPYDTFAVTAGYRYRLRFINAGSTVCPTEIQIENHTMTIIATDGSNIQPVTVNTLTIFTGERYDVVVYANRPPGLYWIRARLVGVCEDRRIFQNAVLAYRRPNSPFTGLPSSPRTYIGYPQGVTHNSLYVPCANLSNVCVSELRSSVPHSLRNRPIDQKFYFSFDISIVNTDRFFSRLVYDHFFNIFGNNVFIPQVNNLSYMMPSSPLLSQPEDIDLSMICNERKIPRHCDDMEVCQCTHVIDIAQNAVVEVVLFDVSPEADLVVHPMHLHGFKFAIMSEGQLLREPGALTVERVKKYEAAGYLRGTNPNTVLKDNVMVKSKGFVVIRFVADNPGMWFVHCHIDDHMMFGMSLVLNVSGPVPPPPPNFPRCGDFNAF